MPYLLSLARILQSLLDAGSVVPAHLRDRLDDQTAHAVERTIGALSEVALQRHQHARASETHEAMQEGQEVLLSEIAIHARTVRADLLLTPQEAVRRLLLIIGFARTVLNADEQLEKQVGPDAGRFFQQLVTQESEDGMVDS